LEGDQELLFYLQKSTSSQFDAQKFFCLFALAHFSEAEKFPHVSKVHMHYPTGADTTATAEVECRLFAV